MIKINILWTLKLIKKKIRNYIFKTFKLAMIISALK